MGPQRRTAAREGGSAGRGGVPSSTVLLRCAPSTSDSLDVSPLNLNIPDIGEPQGSGGLTAIFAPGMVSGGGRPEVEHQADVCFGASVELAMIPWNEHIGPFHLIDSSRRLSAVRMISRALIMASLSGCSGSVNQVSTSALRFIVARSPVRPGSVVNTDDDLWWSRVVQCGRTIRC